MMSIKTWLANVVYPPGVTHLPFKAAITIFLLLVLRAMSMTMVFAYLPQLIRSYGFAEVSVGRYAGFVGSSLLVSQTIFSYLFGYILDVKGKKKTLMWSSIGLAIATLAFGFSAHYYWALITRFCQGIFNLLLVGKVVMLDLCDDTNRSVAMTLSVMAYSTGLTIGPVLGGYLAFPAAQYPNVFKKGSIFDKCSILLPNLLLFLSFVIVIIMMQWAIPPDKSKKETKSGKTQEVEDEDENKKIEDRTSQKPQVRRSWKTKIKEVFQGESNINKLLRNKTLMISCALYFLQCVVTLGFIELFPVWLATTKEYYGLQFDMSQIGTIMMIPAIMLLMIQPLIMPRVTQLLGPRKMFMLMFLLIQCLFPLFPISAKVGNMVTVWVFIIILFFLTRLALSFGLVAVNLFVSNSVRVELLGSANGLGSCISSIGRMVGPIMFGSTYSWSLTNIGGIKSNTDPLGYPFNQYFAFLLLSFVCVITVVGTLSLPYEIDEEKTVEKEAVD